MPFLHNIIISLMEFKAKLTLNSCDKHDVITSTDASAFALLTLSLTFMGQCWFGIFLSDFDSRLHLVHILNYKMFTLFLFSDRFSHMTSRFSTLSVWWNLTDETS